MATQPKTCAECDKPLDRRGRNKTGLCHSHATARIMQSEENRARLSKSLRHKFRADPQARAALLDQLRVARSKRIDPGSHLVRLRLWERTHNPAGSESRKRAGKRRSATVLAWCPPKLRGEYRFLVRNKGLKAAEARAIILEQHEADMRRWRQSIAPTKYEAFEPIEPIDATLDFLCRASIVAARSVGIPELWVPLRTTPVVRARWAVLIALQSGDWSVPKIAAAVGMDRKTVTYGLRQAEALMADAEFNALLRKVAAA